MLLLRTMINVKITNRTEKEDYVAVERETGAIALPSKHVFAIFSVGIISVLLALPFGQLIPENYSIMKLYTVYFISKKYIHHYIGHIFLKTHTLQLIRNFQG